MWLAVLAGSVCASFTSWRQYLLNIPRVLLRGLSAVQLGHSPARAVCGGPALPSQGSYPSAQLMRVRVAGPKPQGATGGRPPPPSVAEQAANQAATLSSSLLLQAGDAGPSPHATPGRIAVLQRQLSVPQPSQPTPQPPAALGLNRQLSLPAAAAAAAAIPGGAVAPGSEPAAKRQRGPRGKVPMVDLQSIPDESERKRQQRLQRNRETAAASRWVLAVLAWKVPARAGPCPANLPAATTVCVGWGGAQ